MTLFSLLSDTLILPRPVEPEAGDDDDEALLPSKATDHHLTGLGEPGELRGIKGRAD
ncbi:MAG: hypothetical protein ACLQUY_06150 [Ktedonobacterales bacterium]